MTGTIRAACASNGGELLDGHFGACAQFLVYEVSPEAVRLVEARDTEGADEAEDRNVARAALISDCQVLFVQSIGGPAAAKVVRAGVHPVKVPKAIPAADFLVKLQAALGNPPPWLAKAMGVEAASLNPYRELVAAGEES
jgi:nitrogen fixation protein NifX